jgi:hypothetical protein
LERRVHDTRVEGKEWRPLGKKLERVIKGDHKAAHTPRRHDIILPTCALCRLSGFLDVWGFNFNWDTCVLTLLLHRHLPFLSELQRISSMWEETIEKRRKKHHDTTFEQSGLSALHPTSTECTTHTHTHTHRHCNASSQQLREEHAVVDVCFCVECMDSKRTTGVGIYIFYLHAAIPCPPLNERRVGQHVHE